MMTPGGSDEKVHAASHDQLIAKSAQLILNAAPEGNVHRHSCRKHGPKKGLKEHAVGRESGENHRKTLREPRSAKRQDANTTARRSLKSLVIGVSTKQPAPRRTTLVGETGRKMDARQGDP